MEYLKYKVFLHESETYTGIKKKKVDIYLIEFKGMIQLRSEELHFYLVHCTEKYKCVLYKIKRYGIGTFDDR